MKEAITGAMLALGALTMPSHAPAQGPAEKPGTSAHAGDPAKAAPTVSWVKAGSRQERLLAEAIEPGLTEGLRTIGLGVPSVKILLQPEGLESATIRPDGSVVLTARRLHMLVSKLVEHGVPAKQAARVVGILTSEIVAHEQRHLDDTKTLCDAVGKNILIGSIELEVLGHRAGAIAVQKLREAGLLHELIDAGKKCPSFAEEIQTRLSWERRASLPARALVNHLSSMPIYNGYPSMFDRAALLAAGQQSIQDAEGSAKLHNVPDAFSRDPARLSLEAISNPESLAKLQDAISKLLSADASRFEKPLREGRSVAGVQLLMAGEDLKAAKELGLKFTPFVQPWGLASLLKSLDEPERQELTTNPDIRRALEEAYQRCERNLKTADPSFGFISPYIALGDALEKPIEGRRELVADLVCEASHWIETMRAETPPGFQQTFSDLQKRLARSMAPAAEFLERKGQ